MENELYKSKSGQGVANLLWYKSQAYLLGSTPLSVPE